MTRIKRRLNRINRIHSGLLFELDREPRGTKRAKAIVSELETLEAERRELRKNLRIMRLAC